MASKKKINLLIIYLVFPGPVLKGLSPQHCQLARWAPIIKKEVNKYPVRLFLPVYRNAAEVEGGDGGHVHVYRVPEVAHGRGEVPPVTKIGLIGHMAEEKILM